MKKSTKETIKNSNAPKIIPNKKFDEYHDMFSFRLKPVSDAYIDSVAEELVKWALSDTDALVLQEFYIKKGMNSNDMKRWCGRNENLLHAHKFSLMILGVRREKGGLKKQLDAGMVSYTMAHYCDVWKFLAEWRSKMTKDEGQTTGKLTIHMEDFPSSPLVPEK